MKKWISTVRRWVAEDPPLLLLNDPKRLDLLPIGHEEPRVVFDVRATLGRLEGADNPVRLLVAGLSSSDAFGLSTCMSLSSFTTFLSVLLEREGTLRPFAARMGSSDSTSPSASGDGRTLLTGGGSSAT